MFFELYGVGAEPDSKLDPRPACGAGSRESEWSGFPTLPEGRFIVERDLVVSAKMGTGGGIFVGEGGVSARAAGGYRALAVADGIPAEGGSPSMSNDGMGAG